MMSFDTLAPHYRWMEWLLAGGKLQRCRTAYIPEVRYARSALLLGEGNGRFLSAFKHVNRTARITVVDASAQMLRQAQRHMAIGHNNATPVCYLQTDALSWVPPRQSFDLIVTNFFLDCFRAEQLAHLVPRIASTATKNAHWIVSDFQVPSRGFTRWRANAIIWAMYRFFRVMTRLPARAITPAGPWLDASGFALVERRVTEWGLLHADLWRRSTD